MATHRAFSADAHPKLNSTKGSEDIADDSAKCAKFDNAATEHAAPANELRPAGLQAHGDQLSTEPARSRDDSSEIVDMNCYSSESDTEDEFNDSMLAEGLMKWTNDFNIKHNALDELLKLLQKSGHRLPSSARSLLNSKRDVAVLHKSGMQYVFLDLVEQLRKFVRRAPHVTELELSINVDGLPLFKSSTTSLWPVLCGIVNVRPAQVFPISLSCGPSKPKDLDFLTDTVDTLQQLLTSGLQVGDRTVPVLLRCVVCDAPARSMVKATKLYSGYAGCDKCTQRGTWLGKMTYQESSDIELRTDDSFRRQTQPEHHHGTSPFCKLPVDMIKVFPIDYMHQCCLGVMRRLLLTWLRGKPSVKLSSGQANEVSQKLIEFRSQIPRLFA